MDQIQSAISSKNQVVIPAIVRRALKLKSGSKLLWKVVKVNNSAQAIIELEPKDWAKYSRGLGKHIWEGVDIDDYIKQLRQEWD